MPYKANVENCHLVLTRVHAARSRFSVCLGTNLSRARQSFHENHQAQRKWVLIHEEKKRKKIKHLVLGGSEVSTKGPFPLHHSSPTQLYPASVFLAI